MPKKILIVDDEPDICRLVSEHLTERGFETAVAYNAETTYQELERFHPDLLILDIFLPDKDGVVIFEELRQNAYYEKLPVIFLTGLAQGTMPQLAGIDDTAYTILPKPANLEDVEREVKRLLRGH